MRSSVSVAAVACNSGRCFSAPRREVIQLVAGHGVEGDAHAGAYVRHRYLARRNPRALNLRVPMKPAMHSNSKPAGYSNRKPATLGVNRVGRFDDVVEG